MGDTRDAPAFASVRREAGVSRLLTPWFSTPPSERKRKQSCRRARRLIPRACSTLGSLSDRLRSHLGDSALAPALPDERAVPPARHVRELGKRALCGHRRRRSRTDRRLVLAARAVKQLGPSGKGCGLHAVRLRSRCGPFAIYEITDQTHANGTFARTKRFRACSSWFAATRSSSQTKASGRQVQVGFPEPYFAVLRSFCGHADQPHSERPVSRLKAIAAPSCARMGAVLSVYGFQSQ